MSKMIQIRNVPTELHQRFKIRATLEGKSLSDYLLDELRASVERPTISELLKTLGSRLPTQTKLSPSEILRKERER